MTGLVVREDLTKRLALSKSALNDFEWCQTQAWFKRHYPLPIIPDEGLVFGSAVDAAVEQIVTFLRSDQPIQMERVMAAAEEVIARDEIAVDVDDVEKAAERFVVEVAGNYDWSLCRTQASISLTLDDLGDVSGHPDLILSGNRVRDVKTSKKQKPDEVTIELGFYALLVEEETGEPVPDVGYFTWVRVKRPYWQRLEFPVTDELRRWTREWAGSYVRAVKADEYLNRKTPNPKNYSFGGGPKYRGKCATCPYAPANGGPCSMAWRGSTEESAA